MKILICFLAALMGLVLGWILTSVAALTIGEFAGVSQFEGAFAMSAVFQIGPIGGLLSACVGGWLGWRWASRRQRIKR